MKIHQCGKEHLLSEAAARTAAGKDGESPDRRGAIPKTNLCDLNKQKTPDNTG